MRSRPLLLLLVPLAAAPAAACSGARDEAPDERIAEAPAAASQPPFLTLKTPPEFLGQNNPTAEDEAERYYQAWGAPATLSDFISEWGFDDEGSDVAGAVYYNAGDLGIGRSMRCVSRGGERACYVDNYGQFGGDSQEALDDAAFEEHLLASVCMTFEPSRGASAVNFVVYDKNGDQLRSVQLDTVGRNTAIPFNCTSCHGGTYDPKSHVMTGGRFLPFDLDTFEFADYDGYTRDDQEYELQRLNAHVYLTARRQNADAVIELIDGWYGPRGVLSSSEPPFQGRAYVPQSWTDAGKADVYTNVIAPYCQSCHVVSTFDLRNAATLPTDVNDVCTAHTMPAAEVPAKNFWSDGSAQQTLAGGQPCPRPDFL